MTYVELIEFLFRFVFINMIEATFIVVFTLIFMKEKVYTYKTLLIIILVSASSAVIFFNGEYGLFSRLAYIVVIGIIISLNYGYNMSKIRWVHIWIVVSFVVMIVVEVVAFIPFLFIFGSSISVINEYLYLTILLSIPTRMLEYIVLHILRNRMEDKNEKSI